MPTTLIVENNVATGVRFNFAEAGDNLAILEGVTVASVDFDAIRGNTGGNSVRVDGTVIAEESAIFLASGDNRVTVGQTGRVVSNNDGTSGAAIGFGSDSDDGGSILTNYGEISAPGRIGVLAPRADIVNHGAIDGVSPVFLGAFGRAGATLTNSGTISAAGIGADEGLRYLNGVYFEGDNGLLNNTETGVITATEDGAAGVRFGAGEGTGGGGGRVINAGEISSLGGIGVDAGEIDGAGGIRVVNSGLIASVGGSAIRGSGSADTIINTGDIFGNVTLGNGADTYRAIGDGTATGLVRGGAGTDELIGGLADDDIDGGNGADLLRGGAGDDTLAGGRGDDDIRGGAGDDTLGGGGEKDLIRGGAGDDDILGSTGTDTLFGGRGDDTVKGGNQADTIDGGQGFDVLTGGLGRDVFVFDRGHDTDRVTDFQDGKDKVDIRTFNLTDFDALDDVFTLDEVDGAVTIDTGSDLLVLEGVTLAQLGDSDFLF